MLAAALAAFAIRPLVPAGTLLARRGLPSVILLRALVAGTFFASEVYVPLIMVTEYGLSAAVAGLALTAAGLTWSGASWVQGHFPGITNRTAARLGALGLTIALAALIALAVWHLSPFVAVVAWAFAGAGMGILYPRLGVLTLEYSTPDDQGFNSSALSISDATGSADRARGHGDRLRGPERCGPRVAVRRRVRRLGCALRARVGGRTAAPPRLARGALHRAVRLLDDPAHRLLRCRGVTPADRSGHLLVQPDGLRVRRVGHERVDGPSVQGLRHRAAERREQRVSGRLQQYPMEVAVVRQVLLAVR